MDAGTALSSKLFMTFVVHYPTSSFPLSFHMVPNHLYLTDIVYILQIFCELYKISWIPDKMSEMFANKMSRRWALKPFRCK